MHILDCTLRDGGYYLNWDFPQKLVRTYLKAMGRSGVEYVELGFCSFLGDESSYAGQFRYASESFVSQLPRYPFKLGVMIESKEITQLVRRSRRARADVKNLLSQHFVNARKSRLSFVRIATNYDDLSTALTAAKILLSWGYEVTINLMKCSSLSPNALLTAAQKVAKAKVSVFYIADSYGAFTSEDVTRVHATLKPFPFKKGVHFHDNTGKALQNSLRAAELGFDFIDGTIAGIGRGPGNLDIKSFIQKLPSRQKARYTSAALSPSYKDILPLKKKYRWGPNRAYALSAKHNIHPLYVQKLMETKRYTQKELLTMIHLIKQSKDSGNFSQTVIDTAIAQRFSESEDLVSYSYADLQKHFSSLNARGKATGRDILIIGRGPSTLQRKDAINAFIQKHAPIVFECNFIPFIEDAQNHFSLFTLFENAASHSKALSKRSKKAILGFPKITEKMRKEFLRKTLFHVPYTVHAGSFRSGKKPVLPADVVSMYAFALALTVKPRTIYLAGFDGYGGATDSLSTRMQSEMEKFFLLVPKHVRYFSITPTTYSIPTKSIYGLLRMH